MVSCMRFLRQSIAPFAAVVLLCGFLSACAADAPQPTILAAPSGGPSPSAVVTSPSPGPEAAAAPVLPAEAREQTAAGAIAFVRHYFAVVDYAYATGDTAPLAAISDAECRPCAGIQEMIDSTIRDGGSYDTLTIEVSKLTVPDGEPLGAIEVHMIYSAGEAIKLNSNGKEVHRLASASDEHVRVILVPFNANWRMYDYNEMTA